MTLRPWSLMLMLTVACSSAMFIPGCSSDSGTPGTAGNSGSGAKRRIIILTNGDHPFWDACEAGADQGAKDFQLADSNLEMSFQRGDFTVKGQLDKLKQYGLETDIVGVGISVFDAENPAIAEELKKLKEAGIKIITIDGEVDRDTYRDIRTAYIGTDNLTAGGELGKATAAVRPEGGNYAIFVGNKGNANAKGRMNGFKGGVTKNFVEVETLDDQGKPENARTMVKDALDRHPEINVLVGIWAYDGPACAAVAVERGVRATTTIVTFDADEQSIAAMEKGELDLMVVQDPYDMGYQGVKLLKALVLDDQATFKAMFPKYGEPDGDLYRTGLKLVVPDSGSKVTQEILDPDTQFLKLSEFKEWMKKYGLKAS